MGGCLSKKNASGQGANGYSYQRPSSPSPPSNHGHRAAAPAPAAPEPRSAPPSSLKPSPPKTAPPRPAPAADTILGKPFEDVKSLYALGKELGRGQFGVTYLCTEHATGQKYACKSISKRKLINKTDKEDIKREIQIMQHLSGQPNIVEFKGAYEDKYSVQLVMELCAGGELFDRIIAKGHYSERAAATVCRAIINVVNICHFMGVLHRDLKPENFLLLTKDEGAMLKATDFGLSVFIDEVVNSGRSMSRLDINNALLYGDLDEEGAAY